MSNFEHKLQQSPNYIRTTADWQFFCEAKRLAERLVCQATMITAEPTYIVVEKHPMVEIDPRIWTLSGRQISMLLTGQQDGL